MYQAQIVYNRPVKDEFDKIVLRGTIDTIPNLHEPPKVSAVGGLVMIRFGVTIDNEFESFYELVIRQENFLRLAVTDTNLINFEDGGGLADGLQ